jgi:ABC-type multidrug transport system fused ATPase/permease subunit
MWLRQNIAIVEQTTNLFPGTIFENIAMGKHGATFEDVVTAARLVRIEID